MQIVNQKLRLFLSISFGVFLFILFFQPFPLIRFDFNNSLLFFGGFGAIIFLVLMLVHSAQHYIFQYNDPEINEKSLSITYLRGITMMILSSLSFAFYLRYVGYVNISFYIVFKIVFICLTPPVILRIYEVYGKLKQVNEDLTAQKSVMQEQVHKYEANSLNQSITFESDNNSENLTLMIADIVFFKSADNYVEIVFKEGDRIIKKLIRNTLRNIEHQIKPYTNFVRCHRTCIVNILNIEKLNKGANNHWLAIRDYPEEIPVSRQYLLRLKTLT